MGGLRIECFGRKVDWWNIFAVQMNIVRPDEYILNPPKNKQYAIFSVPVTFPFPSNCFPYSH